MDGPMPLTRTKDNLEIWGIVLYSTRMNDECWMTKFLIREKKEKTAISGLMSQEKPNDEPWKTKANYHTWSNNWVTIRRGKDES